MTILPVRLPPLPCRPHLGTPARAAVLTLACALAAPLRADSPRDELLRYLPDNVAFCLIIQDLRGHGQALLDSPFLGRWLKTPEATALANSPVAEQLSRVEKQLQKNLGFDWTRLREDILGDALVLAYRPGPPGQKEKEQGILLLRARTEKALGELVDRFNQVQKDSGELKSLEAREHQGMKYFRREDAKQTVYYHMRGPILVLSGQEDMLLQALERGQPVSRETTLAERIRPFGLDRALLLIWVNPRPFDAHLEAKLARGEDLVLRTFSTYWKALEGIACAVALDKDLTVSLAVRARPQELPPVARRLFTALPQPSELWSIFPDNALLAVAGRIDLPTLVEFLGEFLTPASRQALQNELNVTLGAVLDKDLFKDVLPQIGPDWGLCLTRPEPADKNWCPGTLVALRVAPGPVSAPVDQALLRAIHSFMFFAVLGHNQANPDKAVTLKTQFQDKHEVKYLVGERAFPPGVQPALTLRQGFLLLAGSPEAFRRFREVTSPPPAASGTVPVARLSLKDWRLYLQERRAPLSQEMAGKNGISKEEAQRRLDGLISVLELLDRLDVSQRVTPGQVTLTVRLQTALPLKK